MRHRRADLPVEALLSCAATIEQVQRASRHLETLLRTQSSTAVTGPADLYHLLGACQQIATSFQHSFSHIQSWLNDQQSRDRLATDQGPFAGEADAAVATTVQALTDARRASTELQDALTRAQLAMTDLYDQGPIAGR